MFRHIHNFFRHHYHLKYHGVYRHAKKLFVFDMALLALAILMLGTGLFFFFWKPGIVDLIDLSVSLGEQRIISGQPARLSIEYKNRSKFILKNPVLRVHLPAGFIVNRKITSESAFSSSSAINLPDILPGGNGRAEVAGWYWAPPNEEEKIAVFLTYQTKNDKQLEMKVATFGATLPDSILRGELSIASSSLPNASVPFTYTLANAGSYPVANIALAHNWPEKITDEPLAGIALTPNETKEIKGAITLSAKNDRYDLEITPAVRINNALIRQRPSSRTIRLYKPLADCILNFVGNTSFAEPAQTLLFEARIKNKGDVALRNAEMRLFGKPNGMVNWRISANINRFRMGQNEMLLDKTRRTAFSKLDKNDEEIFRGELALLPRFSLGQMEKVSFKLEGDLRAEVAETAGQKFSVPCSGGAIPAATELTLNSEARYYTGEGDQLGRGPLPPRLGRTTKYWIFVQLYNTTNPVKDLEFGAALPAGAQFTGRQSVTIGPEIRFDASSRRVSWSHNFIPPHSQVGLYFEVAVTPTPEQIGGELRLANNISLTAEDDATGKKFNFTRSVITNALLNDDSGARFGYRVVGE